MDIDTLRIDPDAPRRPSHADATSVARIERDFALIGDPAGTAHPGTATAEQIAAMNEVRVCLQMTALAVLQHCPNSRERSTTLTRLEETMFWADAAVLRAGGHAG